MKFKQIPLNAYEEKLHHDAIATAALYKRQEAPLVVLIEEIDRLKLYQKFGETSTIKYCLKILKLTKALSYSFQVVARKTRAVPELLTAIEDGLSISTATKITGQLTPENQAMWIERAHALPQYDLCQMLAAANPKKRRRAKKTPTDKNHILLEIEFRNETFTNIVRAQDLTNGTEAQVIHEALELWLEKNDPVRKADRAMKKNPGAAAQNFSPAKFGVRVPFNAVTLHAVNHRDRGECQEILLDGTKCCSTRYPEIHHIKEVSRGGTNAVENLVTLCSMHHRIYHRFQPRAWEMSAPRATYMN